MRKERWHWETAPPGLGTTPVFGRLPLAYLRKALRPAACVHVGARAVLAEAFSWLDSSLARSWPYGRGRGCRYASEFARRTPREVCKTVPVRKLRILNPAAPTGSMRSRLARMGDCGMVVYRDRQLDIPSTTDPKGWSMARSLPPRAHGPLYPDSTWVGLSNVLDGPKVVLVGANDAAVLNSYLGAYPAVRNCCAWCSTHRYCCSFSIVSANWPRSIGTAWAGVFPASTRCMAATSPLRPAP
ncbi:hypothetical protein FALB51S_00393 [Frigidibacter albus]|uniref:Uncharacterized protein n=1 Tax=Frigidibacter mobilis TaxID=1335048 RepID=A0A159Z6V6_9RHOB|nr:hypothetical protein AKL17_3884 [Frigidibacter mobilis]